MNDHPAYHYKYCPRCTSAGVFNKNEFAFKCNSCGFHFFLNSAAAVTALISNPRGELLLTRRGVEPDYGKLDLPGGFVDPKESAEQSMLRELKEELDLEPVSISYYGSFPNEYLFSGTIVYTVDLVFRCEVTNFENLKYRDDIIGLEFIHPALINLDEIPFQSVKNIIKKIKNEQ